MKFRIFAMCAIFFFRPGLGYNQQTKAERLLKVYRSDYYPMPPFHKTEVKITKEWICFRNIAIPFDSSLKKEQLKLYKFSDTIPELKSMEKADFDSLENFIFSSGIFKIDSNYAKPQKHGGMIVHEQGSGKFGYYIQTTSRSRYFLMQDSFQFDIPDKLKEFDALFSRIVERYKTKGK